MERRGLREGSVGQQPAPQATIAGQGAAGAVRCRAARPLDAPAIAAAGTPPIPVRNPLASRPYTGIRPGKQPPAALSGREAGWYCPVSEASNRPV